MQSLELSTFREFGADQCADVQEEVCQFPGPEVDEIEELRVDL